MICKRRLRLNMKVEVKVDSRSQFFLGRGKAIRLLIYIYHLLVFTLVTICINKFSNSITDLEGIS